VRAALEAVAGGSAATSAGWRYRPVRQRWLLPAATLLVLAAALLGLNAGRVRELLLGTRAPTIESLAVLPLENLSHNPDQEYFADGMTEALIGNLGQIKALRRVISYMSVRQYRDGPRPLPEIARTLNVR
jgi:hypothetical protein